MFALDYLMDFLLYFVFPFPLGWLLFLQDCSHLKPFGCLKYMYRNIMNTKLKNAAQRTNDELNIILKKHYLLIFIMARSGIWVDCEILESKEYDFSIYAVDSSTILRDDLQGELGETLIVIATIFPTIKYEMQRNSSTRIKGILIYDQQKKKTKKGLF